MPLVSRLLILISEIGADIKGLRTNASVLSVNAATRLIHTQRVMAELVSKGKM